MNRLTGVGHLRGPGDVVMLHTLRYDDGLYGAGRLTSMDAPVGQVTFRYDPRGHVISERTAAQTYPSGLEVFYERGPDGRVFEVRTSEGEILATDIDYEPTGALRGLPSRKRPCSRGGPKPPG